MSNSWSKEDRFHFNKSEVMQELEKRVIDTVKRAEILQNKIAQDQATSQEVDNLTKSYEGLAKAKEEAGFADDEVAENALDEDELQEEIIEDLTSLAKAAVEEGNIKLAYRIERAIDEILEQEVKCV